MNKMELLAPAGNWSCLKTAVENGADAVYFGIKHMNMRDNAGNFELNELPRVMHYLKEHLVRGYLTLNTIYYNHELDKVERVVSAANSAGVDAIICWDMAVFSLAKKAGIPVHLSTQASVANYQAFRFYAEMGASRIILARECSLADIAVISRQAIHDGLHCEIETFVHGAMCVSESGRCFLSEETFNKSANRGQCIQPCRRLYKITDVEDEDNAYILGRNYVLSPKDLCSIELLPELIEAGIRSFKIEGRIRPPEYVKTTVSCYRTALDAIESGEFTQKLGAALKEDLSKTYNRGFSEGFYKGLDTDWISSGPATKATKCYCGEVVNYYSKIHVAEFAIRADEVNVGDKILIYGKKTPAHYSVIEEIQVHHESVPSVGKGENCGIKIPVQVRAGDKLFRITD
ncbi:peptidase U32 family protein [Methanogenium organophilum]|uniref:U32 family peptidase n=1 Tax=Methanogenium organophilum TaxID=2199 RepID=A0A9X9S4C8_METOG|nr:peptidase U32 family protein [Methanogenium organophilum]WAI01714.1 U32 family peptidase [Methanogenium organophilum]